MGGEGGMGWVWGLVQGWVRRKSKKKVKGKQEWIVFSVEGRKGNRE